MEVQVLVNNFQMYSTWIRTTPLIFFSIIAGALSDVFGRKPLILIPMIGYFLSSLVQIANYAFIEILPVEFLYLTRISSLFGGYSVLWLGIYGYGTSVTKPEDRTYRLTRIDGVETVSMVVGTLVSPYVFEYLGYYGNYCLCSLLMALAILYLIFFVHEPIDQKKQNEAQNSNQMRKVGESRSVCQRAIKRIAYIIKISVMVPLTGIKSVIFKERKTMIKVVLALQVLSYLLYAFSWQVSTLTYLYTILVFDSFTPKDYAHMSVGISLLRTFMLIFVMPVLSGRLKIHDSLLLTMALCFEILSGILKPFATSAWVFGLIHAIGSVDYCKYGTIRSLLSKCIGPDEVGKVFSVLAVFSAIGPMIGSPAFRQLYNLTIQSCPGAIFFAFAGLMTMAALFNCFTFFKRHQLKPWDENDNQRSKDNAEQKIAGGNQ